jgi:hypothetical protein
VEDESDAVGVRWCCWMLSVTDREQQAGWAAESAAPGAWQRCVVISC